MLKRTWAFLCWLWISLPILGIFLYEIWPVNSEIIKPLVGTFIGAILAFLSNWWFKYESQSREELASGLRALFTIRSQFDDFINVRFALQHSMNAMAKAIMFNEPEWCYAKPMAFNFNPSNIFDFKSLSFLLSTETGRNAYQGLQLIERTYLDFTARHADLNSSALELQKTTAELFRTHLNLTSATLETMESMLGPELPARVKSHLQALVIRIDRDERRYLKVFDELNTVMDQLFGDKAEKSKLIIPEKFKKDNLPDYPNRLKKYLAELPDDIE